MERVVEVFWRISAIADGAIIDQRFGMDHAILEAQAIDEGFQCGAGRAERGGEVHLTRADRIEVACAAHMGSHFAGVILHHQNGGGNAGADGYGTFPRQCFERGLKIA